MADERRWELYLVYLARADKPKSFDEFKQLTGRTNRSAKVKALTAQEEKARLDFAATIVRFKE